ncbi:MAG: hypothetical protein MSIBF_06555 [Candidatus Altiarchaeales archaeon IMC4]|nr:MAG: hypothetical protein MSIBF_06555 [Candidatus Altiarchaeales archaeon IMC4]
MPNFKFSVPYNNDFSMLEMLAGDFGNGIGNNKIGELYLSGPQEIFGSGRIITKKVNIADIVKVISFCHENGIKANLLLNSSCEGTQWYQPGNVGMVLKLIRILHLENDLDAVTLANPLFIQKIKKEFPEIEINASVISRIDSVQMAIFFDKFGADVIIPDRDINRDLGLLKEVKEAVDCELKLMVNEGCLFKCPYKIFHDNWISHASKELINRNQDRLAQPEIKNCSSIFKIDRSQLLKSSWIRPEDLVRYRGITSWFKIVGRDKPGGFILKTAAAYLSEKSPKNLMEIINGSPPFFVDNELLDKDNFFERVTGCNKNCSKCHYCEEFAKKAVREL